MGFARVFESFTNEAQVNPLLPLYASATILPWNGAHQVGLQVKVSAILLVF
jgi:hypothetical protein